MEVLLPHAGSRAVVVGLKWCVGFRKGKRTAEMRRDVT
jgi:hypothetical protein